MIKKEWIGRGQSTLDLNRDKVYCFCQMASSSTSESK